MGNDNGLEPKQKENKMKTSYVSCKTKDSKFKEYKHYKVDEDVYLYILQLEAYIRQPELSKLKEVYKERFLK